MIEAIQQALKDADLDGWLFYSFRGSDPIAANILGMPTEGHMATRRWFYLVPQSGDPVRILHSIERDVLDHLPGKKVIELRSKFYDLPAPDSDGLDWGHVGDAARITESLADILN